MTAAIAPARRAAFEILKEVGRGPAHSDDLLHSRGVDRLSPEDRNLTTALVLGTLRWQRVLNAECDRFLTRRGSLPEDVRLALRLGAYQLLFLARIPAHAAIFESVEWCKQSGATRQAGMVNAVLRKLTREPKERDFDATLAMPEWMTERWRAVYGDEACRKICEQAQQEPPSTVCLLRPEAEDALRTAGAVLRPGAFLANARYVERGTLPRMALDRMGVQIQDDGSQLIAELLGTGERILDCCVAPGGKAAVLLRNNPNAEFVAVDIHSRRLQATEKRLRALFPERRIEYRVADAARFDVLALGDASREDKLKLEPFTRILCDVPCTGTGTLARNPEIRHRLQPDDLQRQARRQRDILSAAMRLLSPGGRLLYSTCSLEPEENEQVVESCLDVTPGFQLMDLREEFDRLASAGTIRGNAVDHLRETAFRGGYFRTLPGVHPCDGFFAALIERK